jgi:general secretion pathway protein C
MFRNRASASKLAAAVVWLLVGLGAVFWGLKLFVRPPPPPPQVATVPTAQALRGDLTRLLGAAPAPEEEGPAPVAALASRFRLVGVVAPRSPRAAAEGLALIAVDGKPPRAYRVGAAVEGELVLQSVRARGADLGARGAKVASVALDIAPLPPPATGVPGVAGGLPPGGVRLPGLAPGMAGRPPAQPLDAEGVDPSGEPDDAVEPAPVTQPTMRQGLTTQ